MIVPARHPPAAPAVTAPMMERLARRHLSTLPTLAASGPPASSQSGTAGVGWSRAWWPVSGRPSPPRRSPRPSPSRPPG
ncbi:MAG: hypothetical protein AVDCRST_MAG49-1684 [uncultured Thermomicrobiales bacterium]|uniref:Uncharacterized protein n=1 Tax=uncultured Thermomicrobiales bacterium TaxID=1645740 RepID=A0A6J4UG59_9BACT|nr:MAG: hypothetical protein AVDCRST_MAG49-1684 [uncultured Thermomicrobiales bacterium]